jgi:hypothetical protein
MICGKVLYQFPDHIDDLFFDITAEDREKHVSDSPEFRIKYEKLCRTAEYLQEGLSILDEIY